MEVYGQEIWNYLVLSALWFGFFCWNRS